MLQPFEDFKPAYISRLLKLDRRWLVSQTYRRVQEENRIRRYGLTCCSQTNWEKQSFM
jgi:hypothetical protein